MSSAAIINTPAMLIGYCPALSCRPATTKLTLKNSNKTAVLIFITCQACSLPISKNHSTIGV
jgi:hypothetical protein